MAKVIEVELETDENGELHLSKEQIGNIGARQNVKVRLETQPSKPMWGPRWANMTPEERAKDFEAWTRRFRDDDAPALSDWAVSRDSIYD